MRALGVHIQNKTKSSDDSNMDLDVGNVGNTTRMPLPLAEHLRIVGEFLRNKDAEWHERKQQSCRYQ